MLRPATERTRNITRDTQDVIKPAVERAGRAVRQKGVQETPRAAVYPNQRWKIRLAACSAGRLQDAATVR